MKASSLYRVQNLRSWLDRQDLVNLTALTLLVLALLLLGIGLFSMPKLDRFEVINNNYPGWLGLFADAFLLFVINWIIKRQEKARLLSQLSSESNAFALDAIRQIRENGWLTNGMLAFRSFVGADLRRANLSGARLYGGDFSFAVLTEARFHESDLEKANLTSANLQGAELRWANLRGANLRWANLRDAVLDGADLSYADLRFADLDGVHLAAARLEGTLFSDPLLPDDVQRVQSLFRQLKQDMHCFAASFYARLFELAPQVRFLFSDNFALQQAKFSQTLRLVVGGLEDKERIIPILQALGRKHRHYNVKAAHFELVNEALVWSFRQNLGAAFDEATERSWKKAYQLIATCMLEA